MLLENKSVDEVDLSRLRFGIISSYVELLLIYQYIDILLY